jgi:hypothetical protein
LRSALNLYQYVAPAILAPASFVLWDRTYGNDLRLVAVAWLLPIAWAYIVPGIGTNLLKVWEFDTRLRLGRFRPHHGFVFGSATAMIAWLVKPRPANDPLDILRDAVVMGLVLGVVNVLYDIKALESGILIVRNEPWARGEPARSIAMDYAPWFFGGFGAMYGAGLSFIEWMKATGRLDDATFGAAFAAVTCATLLVPVAGYMLQSRRRWGHWGTHPIEKRCPSA